MRYRRTGATLALVAALLGSPASALANPVLDVNGVLLSAIRASATAPPPSARAIAMVDIAMYDAVNAVTGLADQPYAYAGAAITGASADAAAYAAGYAMIERLFPNLNAVLQPAEQTALASVMGPSAAISAGLQAGTAVAQAFYAARAGDGSATAQTQYSYGTAAGAYDSTSTAKQPLLPSYGSVKPFVLASGDQFQPPPPPAIGSSEWIAAYTAVDAAGCATCGTSGDQEIARFWSDIGGTQTPPGHWLAIADIVAAAAGLDTLDAARMSAMLGASLADAGIAAWNAKYTYNNWRPLTAIRTCTVAICGVAGDPAWQSLWPAPNFPGYISGHSTFSGAAATALADFFGTDQIAFCDTADPNAGFATPDTRCFASFSAAAAEAGESRILGGIHFEFDNTAGLAVGADVADYVVANAFAVPEPQSIAMLLWACPLMAGLRRYGGRPGLDRTSPLPGSCLSIWAKPAFL